MADIKLIPANCPNCGANLKLPDGLKKAYCTYCGSEVLIGKMGGSAGKIQCSTCLGFGRVDYCRACDGSGHCLWHSNAPSDTPGQVMIGFEARCENGVCSKCGGSGKLFLSGCPMCGGTGRCPQCLGTGKCPACRGLGLIPSPQGIEKCVECDGTGFIEPGIPGAVESGRKCPECKRPLTEGEMICKHCGFKRNLCPSCGAVWITGTLTCNKCGYHP